MEVCWGIYFWGLLWLDLEGWWSSCRDSSSHLDSSLLISSLFLCFCDRSSDPDVEPRGNNSIDLLVPLPIHLVNAY